MTQTAKNADVPVTSVVGLSDCLDLVAVAGGIKDGSRPESKAAGVCVCHSMSKYGIGLVGHNWVSTAGTACLAGM